MRQMSSAANWVLFDYDLFYMVVFSCVRENNRKELREGRRGRELVALHICKQNDNRRCPDKASEWNGQTKNCQRTNWNLSV